jgi:dolichol-phosphate mannosyltransferase
MMRACRCLRDVARAPETGCVLRFACVGLTGVVVNSLLLWILTERTHVYYLVSSVLATEGAILSNFVLNHFWTFATLRDDQSIVQKLLKFNVVSLGGLGLTVMTLYVLTHFGGLHYLLANVFAVGAGAAWNYVANRLWTWRFVYDQASAGGAG